MFFNKYKNKKESLDGYSFASKLEAALYQHLKLLEQQGVISNIKCQPHIFLTAARIEMIPDFSGISTQTQLEVFFEAKGFETDVWRIKRKLWKVYGPGMLRVYKGTHKKIFLAEQIIPTAPLIQMGFELGNAKTK